PRGPPHYRPYNSAIRREGEVISAVGQTGQTAQTAPIGHPPEFYLSIRQPNSESPAIGRETKAAYSNRGFQRPQPFSRRGVVQPHPDRPGQGDHPPIRAVGPPGVGQPPLAPAGYLAGSRGGRRPRPLAAQHK